MARSARRVCAELAEDPQVRRGRLILELRSEPHCWTYERIERETKVPRGSAHRWQRLATDTRGSDDQQQ